MNIIDEDDNWLKRSKLNRDSQIRVGYWPSHITEPGYKYKKYDKKLRNKRCRGKCSDPMNAEYTDEERVWLMVVETFKQRLGVVSLDAKQILELAFSLGYRKT